MLAMPRRVADRFAARDAGTGRMREAFEFPFRPGNSAQNSGIRRERGEPLRGPQLCGQIAPMNLSRIVERHAQFQPHKVALHFHARDLSYRALWTRIERITDVLAERLQVARGDRIAYLGYNDPELLVLLFALARLGAILVPLNFRLAPPELQYILEHAQARLLFIHPDFATAVAPAPPALASLRCVSLQGAHSNWLDWTELSAAPAAPASIGGADDDPVLLVYTSGTTGRPKGAVHTQQALIWNAVNSTHAHDLTNSDHVLMALPMFHVGGLCIQTVPALHAGATVTIHERFDPMRWLGDVVARRPTLSLLVPATAKAVIDHPDWSKSDLSSLRLLQMGSSTIPDLLIRAFLDRGVAVGQIYGSTETGPVSIYLRAADAYRKVGFAGKAGLHTEVRLVGEDGRDVSAGQVGEIWVRGANLMQGYWRDPHNPSYRDGWFRSGDLARQDEEGFYLVVGRGKDMIISGGENIYPAELENVLASCPDIFDHAVIGQDDPKWGEVAVAVIVKRPGAVLDEAAVLQLFDGKIARYKHPRRVVFADALPKSALGKVQKIELKKLLS
jgi:fatty-acyl-CoA synthase